MILVESGRDAQLDNYRGGQMCIIGLILKKKKRGDERKHNWHVLYFVDSVGNEAALFFLGSDAAPHAGGPDWTGLRRY